MRERVLAVDLVTMQIVRFARAGTDTLGIAFRGGKGAKPGDEPRCWPPSS